MDNNYLGKAERAIVTENAYNTAIGEIIESDVINNVVDNYKSKESMKND